MEQRDRDIEAIRVALFTGQKSQAKFTAQRAFFRIFGHANLPNRDTQRALARHPRDIDSIINERAGVRFCHHSSNLLVIVRGWIKRAGRSVNWTSIADGLESISLSDTSELNSGAHILRKRASLARKWAKRIRGAR